MYLRQEDKNVLSSAELLDMLLLPSRARSLSLSLHIYTSVSAASQAFVHTMPMMQVNILNSKDLAM